MPYTVDATNGVRYRRQLGTSGEAAHSWSANTAPLDTVAYPLMFGLYLTNATGIIGGVPNLPGATNVTITAWENAGNSGASVSSVFAITVTTGTGPPVIVTQPTNLSVLLGGSASFTVSASGTSPFRYQWRYKGTNIANATNATLSLLNVQSAQAGGYSAAVTNSLGGVISQTAQLIVLVKPTITIQPTNFVSFPGSNATFFIQGAGTLPLGIRWRRNAMTVTNGVGGVITSTSSNSTLILTNLDLTNDGALITAVITNVAGQGPVSTAAVLRIFAPPVILTQPASQNVPPGADVSLSVTARGLATLRYQWSRDGTALPDRTNATLVLTNVQLSDEGSYTVTVTNRDGMVVSDAASLTVGSHPVLSSPEYVPGAGFRFVLEETSGKPISSMSPPTCPNGAPSAP
jgi:hypothetical protein